MCFCLCTLSAGARSRHCLPLFSTRSPASRDLKYWALHRKPISDRVSSFSFASQAVASGWAFFLGYSGPPLVTPSAALPSRLSLSPGGGITRGRWQSDPAATATRSNAGKYLARFDISMRVNESIRSGNSQEAPPGGGATAADRHRPDCPALPLPLLEDEVPAVCRVQFISRRAISTLTQERNMAPPFTLEKSLSFSQVRVPVRLLSSTTCLSICATSLSLLFLWVRSYSGSREAVFG